MTQIMQTGEQSVPLTERIQVDWERVAWLVIIVLTLATRLWALGDRAMSHDESLHTFYSWKLFIGEGYSHDPMMHGPLLYHFTALSYFLFGASDFAARLLAVVAGLGLVLSPILVRRWLGPVGALAAGVMLLVSPSVMMYSRYIRHDIPVELFTALMFISFFRYLHDRSSRWVIVALAAAAGAITSAEMSYINGFVLVAFILFALLAEWGGRKLTIQMSVILTVAGAAVLGAAVWGEGRIDALYVKELDLAAGLLFTWGIGSALMIGPQERAGLWRRLKAVPLSGIAAGIGVFAVIYTLMFTTFFTNMSGINGFYDSIVYWLDQHGVERGSQPWYYYMLFTPLYEYLPVVLAIGGAVVYAFRPDVRFGRGNDRPEGEPPSPAAWLFVPMAVSWAFGVFWIYSWAGEKMPWLIVHLVVPMTFIAGRTVGDAVDAVDWGAMRSRGWQIVGLTAVLLTALTAVLAAVPAPGEAQAEQGVIRSVLGVVIAAGLAGTIWAIGRSLGRRQRWLAVLLGVCGWMLFFNTRDSLRANFINDELANEYLVYAHGTPDDKAVYELLTEMEERKGPDDPLRIGYDNEVSWPFTWYFRRTNWYRPPDYLGEKPGDAQSLLDLDAVLVGSPNYGSFEPWLRDEFVELEFRRMWWPNEGYKGLTTERVVETFTNPRLRRNLINIVLERRYTTDPLAEVPQAKPLDDWYHHANMRLYIKKDVVETLWPQPATRPQLLAGLDLSAAERTVARLELAPQETIQQAGDLPLRDPKGIDIGPDDDLYVLDHGNKRVVRTRPDGTLVDVYAEGELEYRPDEEAPDLLPSAWGIAVDQDGAVYIADTWNHRILRYVDGELDGQFGTSGVPPEPTSDLQLLFGPRDVAIRDDGHVFFTDTGNKRIIELDADLQPVRAIGGSGTDPGQFNEPTSLAFDPETGELYVADLWNLRIQVFDRELRHVRNWQVDGWGSTEAAHKAYIAVDDRGTVMVSDPVGARVWFYSRQGDELGTLDLTSDPDGLSSPIGVAFDGEGHPWVASAQDQRVTRYERPTIGGDSEDAAASEAAAEASVAMEAFLDGLTSEQATAVREALLTGADPATVGQDAGLDPDQTQRLAELVAALEEAAIDVDADADFWGGAEGVEPGVDEDDAEGASEGEAEQPIDGEDPPASPAVDNLPPDEDGSGGQGGESGDG